MKRFLAAAMLLLAACSQQAPEPARPALWQITGPNGEQGWLFGTIHALPRPYDWQTPGFAAALRQADRVAVEVGNLDQSDQIAQVFARLGKSAGQRPLAQRVRPDQQAALHRLLLRTGMDEASFAGVETWAAALGLARAASPEQDTSLGVDRAVLRLARPRPVIELEGAEAQLRIFDALPETEQRDLLAITVAESLAERDPAELAQAWARGDLAALEAELRRGLLADPELRAALLVNRNRAWTAQIAAMLRQRQRPLVAVGTGHLLGSEGLPSMLAAQGFAVQRIQ